MTSAEIIAAARGDIPLAGMCTILRITIHPAADLFPMMSDDELDVLKLDIERNGLRMPLVFYRNGQLLDGRNRLLAAARAGLANWEILRGKRVCKEDPYAFVISANINRRHLTTEQRKVLAAKVLAEDPSKSDRALAQQFKLDHKTVGAVRDKLAANGEIPHSIDRTEADGKKARGRKPGGGESVVPRPAPVDQPSEEPRIDLASVVASPIVDRIKFSIKMLHADQLDDLLIWLDDLIKGRRAAASSGPTVAEVPSAAIAAPNPEPAPVAPPEPTGWPKIEVAAPQSSPTPRPPRGEPPVCQKPSGVCGYGGCGAKGKCLYTPPPG